MICNVITSPYGKSSIAFGAITTAAAAAFVIFQAVAPGAFASCGGAVLYVLPGATGFASISCMITSIIEARSNTAPIEETTEVPFDFTSGNYKNLELREHLRQYLRQFYQKHYVAVTTRHYNISSLAGALNMSQEKVEELFQFFGFPQAGWNDHECIHAFFTWLSHCGFNDIKFDDYALDLEAYFRDGHPFWPKELAPSTNPTTVKHFAEFLFISVDRLKEEWVEIRDLHENTFLECAQMSDFCKNKKFLTIAAFPPIFEIWFAAKNKEIFSKLFTALK